MRREEKRAVWRRQIAEFRASGMSNRAEWCRQQGLDPDQMRYWIDRLGAIETEATDSGTEEMVILPQWPSMSVADQGTDDKTISRHSQENGGSLVSLRVGPVVVDVQPGFDRQVLSDVLCFATETGIDLRFCTGIATVFGCTTAAWNAAGLSGPWERPEQLDGSDARNCSGC